MSVGKLITILKPDRKEILRNTGICLGIAILSIILSLIQSFWLTKEIKINLFDIPENNLFHKVIAAFIIVTLAFGAGAGVVMVGVLIFDLLRIYDIYIYENGFEYQNSGFCSWEEVEFDLKIPDEADLDIPCCCFIRKSEKPVFFDNIPYEGIIYDPNSVNTHMEALCDYLNEQKSKYQNSQ